MKFVALRPFTNVKKLGVKLDDSVDPKTKKLIDPGFIHQDHIHKGAEFEYPVGKGEKAYADLDAGEKEVVGQLIATRAACIDDRGEKESVNKGLIEKIKREAAKEREQLAKANAVPNMQEQIAAAVAAAIQALGIGKTADAK